MASAESPVSPDVPPTSKPSGARRIAALAVVAVLVVAGLAVMAYVLLVASPPGTGVLDRVEISSAKNRIDQREGLQVAAAAFDTAGSNRTSEATFAWQATPGAAVQITPAGASASLIGLQAGSVVLRATATLGDATRSANFTLAIDPLAFVVTPSEASPLVGAAFGLEVKVVRTDASPAAGYRGTVNFTSDDPLAVLPGNAAFTAQDAGTKSFADLKVRKVGTVRITVRDTLAPITQTLALPTQRPLGAPTATFTADRTLMHVDVDASGSTDPDGDIATYAWDWGDGSSTAPSADPAASHDYANPGRYLIVLTVADSTGAEDFATRKVSPAPSTIDFVFSDFFDVPFQDYWDIRQILYFERPINAECFNATSIADGTCTPGDPNVPDVATYPYTNWWSAFQPGFETGVPFVYARYNMHADGDDVPGYTLSEPVYLPVWNYSQTPGNRLDLRWRLGYMGPSRADRVGTDCGTNFVFNNDGYIIESQIELVMDLQTSRRIFDVRATDPASAQAWWDANTIPGCIKRGPVENRTRDWFVGLGGSVSTIGKYDIATGYEWYYQPFTINITGEVDPATGLTHVNISHTAYGTEVLLGRMFYWGNASYRDNWADSTKARGWLGMEVAWYEDLELAASYGSATHDFSFSTSMAYHFALTCSPGPNGQFDRTDDVPYWTWGPALVDYVHDFQANHPISELDRYPTETYTQCAPGASASVYGKQVPFDSTPITWDLPAGHTWTFRFPLGPVVFYDPNLTPPKAFPTSGQFVEIRAPLEFGWTTPAAYGDWDPDTMTWQAFGPLVTGGPAGSPGNYAQEPWPTINLVPGSATVAASSLAGPAGAPMAPYRETPNPLGSAGMGLATVAVAAFVAIGVAAREASDRRRRTGRRTGPGHSGKDSSRERRT